MRAAIIISSIAAGLLLPACPDSSTLIDGRFSEPEWQKLSGFTPLPPPPPSPTNRFADDPRAAAFGQRLWFESRYAGPILAGSPADGALGNIGEAGKVSCAECHNPAHWFTDTRTTPNSTSLGASWTKRNSPSIVNVAYYEWVGWGGAHDQLWRQAATVVENRDVFNSDRLRYAHVIFQYYRDDYNALFDPDLDPALDPADTSGRFPPSGKPKIAGTPDGPWEAMSPEDQRIVNEIMANCGKAIEAYERLLVSRNAPFDKYVAGDLGALSESAKRGLKLFIGKAACDSCHHGETFTDQQFHNTGVTQTGASLDQGRFDDAPRISNPFNGAGAFSDDPAAGMAKIAGVEQTEGSRGQFRTKSLRHVSGTGPYFHDGSMPSLVDVIRFYNNGGGANGFPGVKDERMVPLNLTESEILDLVAFLESLTGDPVPEGLTRDTSAAPVARLGTHISAE